MAHVHAHVHMLISHALKKVLSWHSVTCVFLVVCYCRSTPTVQSILSNTDIAPVNLYLFSVFKCFLRFITTITSGMRDTVNAVSLLMKKAGQRYWGGKKKNWI